MQIPNWLYRLGHNLNVVNWYRNIKWFIQRGTRGYADKDAWSADSYLCEVIAGLAGHLHEHHVGFPDSMFPEEYQGGQKDTTPEMDSLAMAKWCATLTKIREGFEAYLHVQDWTTYAPPEVWLKPDGTPYPKDTSSFHEMIEALNQSGYQPNWNVEALKVWEDAQMDKFEEAMQLFTEHFHNLWD